MITAESPVQTYDRRGHVRAAANSARTNGTFILRSARSVRIHAIQWDGARMQLTNEDVRARRCEGSWGLSGCGNPDRTAGTAGKHPCKHGQQGTGSARQSEQEDKNHPYRRCATQGRHRGPAARIMDACKTTPTSPPLATSRQPTLRININDDDDDDNDSRNDVENQAATSCNASKYT